MSEPRVFAVAPSIPALAMCGVKLTAGKLYPVLAETEAMFDLVDDAGSQVPCFWEECGFLAGGNWIRAVLDDEPKQVSGWQPIETAPKDGWGAPILTCRMGEPTDWFGKEPVGGYAEPPEAAYWNEHGDCWTPCQRPHDGWEPTHWMPLFTAPSQIEEGKDNG